ncbi:hypothetical protein SAMN05216167_104397 [Spirosoma endophyticum]|uniref:DUF4234 domain-containing protein n=2 Tax=Spirosoma endophyticum TaxID=662367 RepID=A0A1I1RGD1_9BACT|nr:hypothetical protein SAMN05216167_104397 [Spirosoma endophyticum]
MCLWLPNHIISKLPPEFDLFMDNNYQPAEYVDYVKKQPVWVFCLLSFFTFGLYTIYWFYKSWRFFRESYGWDIYPVWRAIFAVFFTHSLLETINDLAIEKGHPGISSNPYATGYVVIAIVQRLLDQTIPTSLALLPLLLMPFLFLIPTVKQLNYLYEKTHPNEYQPAFSPGELVALLLGGIVMGLGVAGTLLGEV